MKKPTFDFLALGLQDYQQDMADERKEKEAEQAEIKTEIELSWAYNPNLWYTDEQIKKEMEIAWHEYDVAADEVGDYFGTIKLNSHFDRLDNFIEKWELWECQRITHIENRKDKIGKRYNALLRGKRHIKANGVIANHRQFKDEYEDYQYLYSPDKKFNYVRGPVVHRRDASWHDEKLKKKARKIRVVRHKAHKHVNKYKNMQKRANKRKNNKKR